jgi:hypothetical protein
MGTVIHVMHRFFMRACAVATAGVALGTWALTAASASGSGSATIHPRAGFAAGRGGALRLTNNLHAAGLNVKVANSRFFAGYQATVTTGSATTSLASFAVPTLTCTTADRAIAASTGIPVRDFKSVSAAFVFVGCVGGTASFFPGLVINGTETDFSSSPFAAGDVIDLITKVSTNRTRVQVTDMTTGVTQKIIGAGGRARAAFIGDEGWGNSSGQLEHVPDFGKLKFRDCIIDGKDLAKWRPHAFQRVNSRGTVQIAIGTLSASGLAFATRFEHS